MKDYLQELKKWFEENIPLEGVVLSFVIGAIFVNITLVVHEFGHVATAQLMGCNGQISVLNHITGMSTISNCSQNRMMYIALAGPLTALIYASILYFHEKDSILRVAGITSFFFSVIPSLYPALKGGDMSKAIEWGLSPILGWLIYAGVFGFVFYNLIQEVSEKEKPFNL